MLLATCIAVYRHRDQWSVKQTYSQFKSCMLYSTLKMQNQIIVFQNPISSFRGKVNIASIVLICGVLNIENATMVEHTTLVPKREIKV